MRPLFLACLPFLFAPLALLADPPASNLRPDILHTAKGEFVQVKPMRPLTLNAHVTQFAYEPLGIEVAVVGQEAQGDNTVHFVKVLDARTGHEMERLTQVAPAEDASRYFHLMGWSASGKCLMVQRYATPDPEPDQPMQYLRWDISAVVPVTQIVDPASALPVGVRTPYAEDHVSPTGRWVLFEQRYATRGADGKFGLEQTAYLLYDPERNTFRVVPVPDKTWSVGWADAGHLRVHCEGPERQLDLSQDVVTDQRLPHSDAPTPAPASKHYPDLTLDVEERLQTDVKTGVKSGGRINSHLLWIRRTPPGKLALGVAAAGLTPGDDDPQAAWSPNGKQIAFLAYGDLFVTDLTDPGPLPKEKLALGLPLTCPEERLLAVSDLKQIGLGLLQFTQDADETWPPAEDIDETILPYVKDRSVYAVSGSHWTYLAPTKRDAAGKIVPMSLADMDEPAQTEIGTLDVPCARVVLYADGHVKSFPKTQETAP